MLDYSREMREFNDFIDKSELVDILMVGRKFTWYKQNGSIKSRIHKVLVSRELLDIWPNSKQIFQSKSISDHCTLILKESVPSRIRALTKSRSKSTAGESKSMQGVA